MTAIETVESLTVSLTKTGIETVASLTVSLTKTGNKSC